MDIKDDEIALIIRKLEKHYKEKNISKYTYTTLTKGLESLDLDLIDYNKKYGI